MNFVPGDFVRPRSSRYSGFQGTPPVRIGDRPVFNTMSKDHVRSLWLVVDVRKGNDDIRTSAGDPKWLFLVSCGPDVVAGWTPRGNDIFERVEL